MGIFECDAVTTVPSPPAICAKTKDFTDLSGNYIKSSCLITAVPSNYAAATSFCASNQMQLFDSNVATTPDLLTYAQAESLTGLTYVVRDSGTKAAISGDTTGNPYSYVTNSADTLEKFLCEYVLESEINYCIHDYFPIILCNFFAY